MVKNKSGRSRPNIWIKIHPMMVDIIPPTINDDEIIEKISDINHLVTRDFSS